MGILAKFFSHVRGRPLHERRVLGVVTYLACAAIVVALWAHSLRSSFAPSGVVAESSSAAPTEPASGLSDASAAAPETPGVAASGQPLAELASPFATLRQTIGDAFQKFGEIGGMLKQLSQENAAAPVAVTEPQSGETASNASATTSPVSAEAGSVTAMPPASQITPQKTNPALPTFAETSPRPKTAMTIGHTITEQISLQPYSDRAIADLVTPPAGLPAAAPTFGETLQLHLANAVTAVTHFFASLIP